MNCGSKQLCSRELARAAMALAATALMLSGMTTQAQQPTGAAASASAVGASSAPAGNTEKGKIAFEKYRCFSCHGHSGDGGISPYPTQAGFRGPRPQVTGAHLAGMPLSFQAFTNYVRKPGGRMPAYGNNITDADLADIYAFLKSVPPSPDSKTTPLLNGQ
jgi:mono/diheme cytochrome c family protein